MRKKSHELQWLEVMSQRKGLDEDEIKIYQRLKRPYQAEVNFDKICRQSLCQLKRKFTCHNSRKTHPIIRFSFWDTSPETTYIK